MAEPRQQFTFYRSYYDAIQDLPKRDRASVILAVCAYAIYEIEPENLSPAASAVFKVIRPTLDSGRRKAQSGKKGGSKQKAKPKQIGSKKEVEVEKEIEYEVEKEYENEIENEYLYNNSISMDGSAFERFWDMYPNKLGKEQAKAAWDAEPPDLATVLRAVESWKRSRQWNQDNGRFIPKPVKFLEEKYYLEIPKDVVPMGASGQLGAAELEAIERIMRE